MARHSGFHLGHARVRFPSALLDFRRVVALQWNTPDAARSCVNAIPLVSLGEGTSTTPHLPSDEG